MLCGLRYVDSLVAERIPAVTGLLDGDWIVNVGEELETGDTLRECVASDGPLHVSSVKVPGDIVNYVSICT